MRPIKRNSSDISESNKTSAESLPKYIKKKPFWAILFSLWIVFIILSQVPLLANTMVDYSAMDDKVISHITFPSDGKQGHYYVERYDTNENGYIDVEYTTKSNSLKVTCDNIKVLRIYCREMYEKKSEDVFKRDPNLDSNYYKTYFIDRDHLDVHVYTEKMIEELAWLDTPIPYNVTVNSREWWLTGVNYTYSDDGIVLTSVPAGHNYINLYFQSYNLNSPVAKFSTSKTFQSIDEQIIFDASTSYDLDGEIVSYVWDLGEGSYKIGKETQHAFNEEGKYNVILKVKDDDYLIDRAFKEITIVSRVMSVSKSVDKQIATPGSILTYTITPVLSASWPNGVRDVSVIDILPAGLEYVDSEPKPKLEDRTLTWNLGSVDRNNELPTIILQTMIDKNVDNGTFIENYVTLDYLGKDSQAFPQELSDPVRTKVNTGTILAPRILSPVPDVVLQEDAPPFDLILSIYEYDMQDSDTNLKWHITENDESLYVISGEYSDNDVITITPLADANGNDLVTLWLEDSSGYSTNQPLLINITPVNDPPIFSKAPDLTVHYNQAYLFNYESYVHDIDTPQEQLRMYVTEKSSGSGTDGSGTQSSSKSQYIHVDGFNVTYIYPQTYLDKQLFVSLIAFDGIDNAVDTIQVNVTDESIPVLIKELPDQRLAEGETKINVFDLDDYFEDPEDDSLFYSFGETHITITINDDHTVDISAPSAWFGEELVTFRARDPVYAIVEDSIVVRVTPVNDPPVIAGLPEVFIVHFDVDYSYDLTPYISDEDNELDELKLIITDPHIRIDPANQFRIIMNYPVKLIDSEIPVMILVLDGIDTASAEITVRVTSEWPPELIGELPDISFYEDEGLTNAFNLGDYFSDKDSNTLYNIYGQEFVDITINVNYSVDLSAANNWYGVEATVFRATDPNFAFVESGITITVLPVNDPPMIEKLPAQYGEVDKLWKVDLTEYISDIDNETNELMITVISNNLDIITNHGELVIYSNKPVKEQVTIIVSDGLFETSETMLIEVTDEDSKKAGVMNILISNMWLIVSLIFIIVTIAGFAAYRRYFGKYKVEEVFWLNKVGILIFHESFIPRKIKPKRKQKKVKIRDDNKVLPKIIDYIEELYKVKKSSKNEIKEFQINEKNVLVCGGKNTFIITVYSGRSRKKLYSENKTLLRAMEFKYGPKLKGWKDGTSARYIKDARKTIKTILSPSESKISSKK